MGKNSHQTFRLVVTDKRNPRDGKYLEMLGWYNPFGEGEKKLSIKSERIEYWLQKGAQISENAKTLIKKSAPQIIKGINEKKVKKITKTKAEKAPKALKPKAEKPVKEKAEKSVEAKPKKTVKAKSKK
jgi:small subunit ribosomal protein S16